MLIRALQDFESQGRVVSSGFSALRVDETTMKGEGP